MIEEENRRVQKPRRAKKKKNEDPVITVAKKILFAIPKNLVYFFVCIIFFAFGAMCWITYTEKDLVQFLTAGSKQEVVIVDPLFTSLKESLIEKLDKKAPGDIDAKYLTPKPFFNKYFTESRPLVVRDYAANWRATKMWADKDYLSREAGTTVIKLESYKRLPWNNADKSKETEEDK